jgi:hypothetical protein
MSSTCFAVLAAAVFTGALIFPIAIADPTSVCTSFGIDFQDGGAYFINSLSTNNFTAVSQFEGMSSFQAVE